MRRLAAALAAIAFIGGAAQAAAPPLRIASISATPGPCRPLEASAPAGEKAYYDHLAERLGAEVLTCPVATPAAAAAALAAGTLDMALLDPAAYQGVKATTRAILTLRADGDVNRIPIDVAVLAKSSAQSLAELKGHAIAFGGTDPAALKVPKQVLAERGAGPGFFSREVVDADEQVAIAHLRAGKVDAVALHVGAWQRVCRPVSPKLPEPCPDLRIMLRARPEAAQAWVVRRDMPVERRYRLIGILLPLHLEAPAAFAWASAWAPHAAEFTPTEAEALTVASMNK